MDRLEARDRPWVSVVGSGDAPADQEAVETVAEGLARRGAVLVTGGLGGTMATACRAYAEADGPLSVGILPGTDRHAANEAVDVPVVTGLGDARNALVGANADAVVAFAGSGGTMSEVGFARVHGTPVVGVGAWAGVDGVVPVDDADEALAVLENLLEDRGRSREER